MASRLICRSSIKTGSTNNVATQIFVMAKRSRMQIQRKNLHSMPRKISSLLHLLDASNNDPVGAPPATSKAGETNSAAQILLMRSGLIQHSDATGIYVTLPLLQRSLDKFVGIVDALMQHALGSQKITLPLLNPASLWTASGREELYGAELISLQDRHHKRMVLTPTHEEAVTKMLVNLYGQRSPHKKLPIRVHQITSKYRDEQRPRSGLLRSREFLMKDLYIFDADIESARKSYDAVRKVYRYLFKNLLNIDNLLECKGSAVKMGGVLSHEFFMPAAAGVGEDTVYWCERGQKEQLENEAEYAINKELLDDDETEQHKLCTNCTSPHAKNGACDIRHCEHVHTTKAVELGHAFIIGDKYSRIFDANYISPAGKVAPLIMSCYGIGVTRVLQAVLERSAASEGALRWPNLIAPFQVCLIGPKRGSKEEKLGAAEVMNDFIRDMKTSVHMAKSNEDRSTIDTLSILDDMVEDDRTELTIGNRLRQMQKLGIPLILVFGRDAVKVGKDYTEDNLLAEPKAEVVKIGEDGKYETKLVSTSAISTVAYQQLLNSRKWKLPIDAGRNYKHEYEDDEFHIENNVAEKAK